MCVGAEPSRAEEEKKSAMNAHSLSPLIAKKWMRKQATTVSLLIDFSPFSERMFAFLLHVTLASS